MARKLKRQWKRVEIPGFDWWAKPEDLEEMIEYLQDVLNKAREAGYKNIVFDEFSYESV